MCAYFVINQNTQPDLEAMSKSSGERDNRCAEGTGDGEILATVRTGDFVADEVTYHAKYLAN